jgi:hypothetical protein
MLKDQSDEKERESVLSQHRKELADVIAAVNHKCSAPAKAEPGTFPSSKASSHKPVHQANSGSHSDSKSVPLPSDVDSQLVPLRSPTKSDWEHQKEFDGASNDALDSLMDMIGLEDVKTKFLDIKARVDTSVRQNVNLKDGRFSAAFLGNPGTG